MACIPFPDRVIDVGIFPQFFLREKEIAASNRLMAISGNRIA
jgi:hypothetical protein